MISRQFRLDLRHEPAFFSHSKKHVGKNILAYTQPADKFQVAVIVGKKVSPKAVTRNAIKRSIMHWIHENVVTSVALPQVKVALRVLPRFERAETSQVMDDLWKKI